MPMYEMLHLPMSLHDFLFIILAFLSEFFGTLSGFGSSAFFVPIAVYLEPFQLVLALTSILHLFGNTSKMWLFREHFQFAIFLRLAIPSLIFAGAGAYLTNQLHLEWLKVALGIVLILISITFLIEKFRFTNAPPWIPVVLCGISGFTTGLVGTGGAIRGVALAALNLERGSFVVLSSAIDFGGDFVRMLIYFRHGFMDWSQWFYIPALAIAALAGAKIGKHLLSKVNHKQFQRIVAFFIFVAGLALCLGN